MHKSVPVTFSMMKLVTEEWTSSDSEKDTNFDSIYDSDKMFSENFPEGLQSIITSQNIDTCPLEDECPPLQIKPEEYELNKCSDPDSIEPLRIDPVQSIYFMMASVDKFPKPASSIAQNLPCVIAWCNCHSSFSTDFHTTIQAYFINNYRAIRKSMNISFLVSPDKNALHSISHSKKVIYYEGRSLFHYIGYGFPEIQNGNIYSTEKINSQSEESSRFRFSNRNQFQPISLKEIYSIFSPPSWFIFDADNGEEAIRTLESVSSKKSKMDWFAIAATSYGEHLPTDPLLPRDFLTSCILSSIKISLVCRILLRHRKDINIEDSSFSGVLSHGRIWENPSIDNQLKQVLTAIVDSIAAESLDPELYQKAFRLDRLTANIFRHFLLAQYLLRPYGCHPVSHPAIPDLSTHPLWSQYSTFLDSVISAGTTLARPLSTILFSRTRETIQTMLVCGRACDIKISHLTLLFHDLFTENIDNDALLLLTDYVDAPGSRIDFLIRSTFFPILIKRLINSDSHDISKQTSPNEKSHIRSKDIFTNVNEKDNKSDEKNEPLFVIPLCRLILTLLYHKPSFAIDIPKDIDLSKFLNFLLQESSSPTTRILCSAILSRLVVWNEVLQQTCSSFEFIKKLCSRLSIKEETISMCSPHNCESIPVLTESTNSSRLHQYSDSPELDIPTDISDLSSVNVFPVSRKQRSNRPFARPASTFLFPLSNDDFELKSRSQSMKDLDLLKDKDPDEEPIISSISTFEAIWTLEVIRRSFHLYAPDNSIFVGCGLHVRILPFLFHSSYQARAEAIATLSCFILPYKCVTNGQIVLMALPLITDASYLVRYQLIILVRKFLFSFDSFTEEITTYNIHSRLEGISFSQIVSSFLGIDPFELILDASRLISIIDSKFQDPQFLTDCYNSSFIFIFICQRDPHPTISFLATQTIDLIKNQRSAMKSLQENTPTTIRNITSNPNLARNEEEEETSTFEPKEYLHQIMIRNLIENYPVIEELPIQPIIPAAFNFEKGKRQAEQIASFKTNHLQIDRIIFHPHSRILGFSSDDQVFFMSFSSPSKSLESISHFSLKDVLPSRPSMPLQESKPRNPSLISITMAASVPSQTLKTTLHTSSSTSSPVRMPIQRTLSSGKNVGKAVPNKILFPSIAGKISDLLIVDSPFSSSSGAMSVVATENGCIIEWPIEKDTKCPLNVFRAEPNGGPIILASTADPNIILTGGKNSTDRICMWNLKTMRLMGEWSHGAQNQLTSLVGHPGDPNQAFAGFKNGVVRLLRLSDGMAAQIKEVFAPFPKLPIFKVDYNAEIGKDIQNPCFFCATSAANIARWVPEEESKLVPVEFERITDFAVLKMISAEILCTGNVAAIISPDGEILHIFKGIEGPCTCACHQSEPICAIGTHSGEINLFQLY